MTKYLVEETEKLLQEAAALVKREAERPITDVLLEEHWNDQELTNWFLHEYTELWFGFSTADDDIWISAFTPFDDVAAQVKLSEVLSSEWEDDVYDDGDRAAKEKTAVVLETLAGRIRKKLAEEQS